MDENINDSSIIQMLMSAQSDLEWFESQVDTLKEKYNNKFIAFYNKDVVESDSNLDNLLNKLQQKGIDVSRVFIKFISKVKTIL